jgi:NAD(P)-dependent dehydrogenase (short-subunit alcohol dehydrogenase family)
MRAPTSERTVLIVGASRGLGLALADEYLKRSWHVIATTRGTARVGLRDLADRVGPRLEIETIDIVETDQISRLRTRLADRRFDLLFVNAGVTNRVEETIGEVTTEEFIRVMITNALSPMRVVEALQDLVTPTGTIGVMSSGLGSVADNEFGRHEVYRASKAALNMLMRSFAARNAFDHRPKVLIAPGWVRTDMGGSNATLTIDESIPRVVDTIAGQMGKPGLHYLDYRGRTVRW